MSHTPHELAAEFPEFEQLMQELKKRDAHFARLFEEYHDLNRKVHRAETDVEPVSDEHMQERRRKRMAIKDEIYALLKKAAQG